MRSSTCQESHTLATNHVQTSARVLRSRDRNASVVARWLVWSRMQNARHWYTIRECEKPRNQAYGSSTHARLLSKTHESYTHSWRIQRKRYGHLMTRVKTSQHTLHLMEQFGSGFNIHISRTMTWGLTLLPPTLQQKNKKAFRASGSKNIARNKCKNRCSDSAAQIFPFGTSMHKIERPFS